MPGARDIAALRTALARAGAGLRARGLRARAEAIEAAARLLLDAGTAEGAALRGELSASTGLHAVSIEHGLRTTLGLFTADALCALYAEHARSAAAERSAPSEVTVVLAGNVFSAAARPLLLPLLCGHPVLVKAASGDAALPYALARALARVDPELGRACAVLSFSRDDLEASAALVGGAERLIAYGSDESLALLGRQLKRGAQLIAHGHGLGAAFVAGDALAREQDARELAQALARDVAAYDQRGCLSPHALLVQAGPAADARELARLLADALDALARAWPRGALPADAGAQQMQWRGVAASLFELHVRNGAAVSYEATAAPRASPGYRNLSVYACNDAADARAKLAPLGTHLKALAFAGTAHARLGELAPYVCAPGEMQQPPLHAPLDGLHPLAGLALR